MRKQKIWSILLTGVLSFSLIFSACKSNDEKENGSENGVTISKKDAVDDGNVVEVVKTNKVFATKTNSAYTVVVPEEDYNYNGSARNYNLLAAQEFVYFMKQALGYTFSIVSDDGLTFDANSKYVSLGETTLFEQTDITIDEKELGSSGYVIRTVGDSIFICGALEAGSLFGVYEFLNHAVGYEYFADEEIYVDKVNSVNLLDFNVKVVPSFDYRYLSSSIYKNDSVNGFNRYRGLNPMLPAGMHNSMTLISRAEYEAKHPEFFGVDVNGNKIAQLNLTAGEALVDEVVKKLTKILEDTYTPEAYAEEQKYLFFGQEDNGQWDRSPESLALYEKYGTDSASLVLFINQVADKIQAWVDENQPGREVIVATFAYGQTLKPPVQYNSDGTMKRDANGDPIPADDSVKLRDNAIIRFASLSETNYFESLEDESNKIIRDYLAGWNALSKTATYVYSVYFVNHYVNVNNFDSIQPSYRYQKEVGVEYIYDQYLSNGEMTPCFNHYRAYLQANLMWNVYADVEELTDRFFAQYYRDAADIMKQYLTEIKLVYEENYEELGYHGELNETFYENKLLWKLGTLLKWQSYMQQAFETIKKYETTDPELYGKLVDRITYESLSVRYLIIRLYGDVVYTETALQQEKTEVFYLLLKYDMQPTNARQQLDDRSWGFESLKEEWGIE